MKNEKYLPVGTVVQLKGAEGKLFIAGFAVQGDNEKKVFDYVGYIYPEGLLSTDENFMFDHEQIEKVHYLGYKNGEWQEFENTLKEIVSQANKEGAQETPKTEPKASLPDLTDF